MVAPLEPFPERYRPYPTVIHAIGRRYALTRRPTVHRTISGLVPYFRNVVVAPESEIAQADGLTIEIHPGLRLEKEPDAYAHAGYLLKRYSGIQAVVGHFSRGAREGFSLSQALNAPLMTMFGGSDINVSVWRTRHKDAFDRILRGTGAYFVAVSRNLLQKAISRGCPPERTYLWHRGLDLEEFRPTPRAVRSGGILRVAMVGRLIEIKGHEFGLQAFAAFRQRYPSAELHVYGEGPLEGRVRQYARDFGLGDVVHFQGHVEPRELRQALRDVDIIMHPSVVTADGKEEGVPNALIEAHAMGIPAVATRHGGIPEVVVDGCTGMLVEENDVRALAEGLERIAVSPELRSKMGREAREHVRREFNHEVQSRRLAARILHMIRSHALVASRRGSPPVNPTALPLEPNRRHPSPDASNVWDVRLASPPSLALTYASNRRFLGPVIVTCKRAIYRLLLRPMLLPWLKEIQWLHAGLMTVYDQLLGQLMQTGPQEGQLPAWEDRSLSGLHMCEALCPECPHCHRGELWPSALCPLDARCLDALHREFADRTEPDHNVGFRDLKEIRPSLLLVDASVPDDRRPPTEADRQVLSIPPDNRLPLPDGAFRFVGCWTCLQDVAEPVAFFKELKRVLHPGGRILLDVWPMANGRSGGRLVGDLAVPFALLFFSSEVLSEYTGAPVCQPRRFGLNDIVSWAREAGLKARADQENAEPLICELEVQARFAALFRSKHLSYRDLIPGLRITLEQDDARFHQQRH